MSTKECSGFFKFCLKLGKNRKRPGFYTSTGTSFLIFLLITQDLNKTKHFRAPFRGTGK